MNGNKTVKKKTKDCKDIKVLKNKDIGKKKAKNSKNNTEAESESSSESESESESEPTIVKKKAKRKGKNTGKGLRISKLERAEILTEMTQKQIKEIPNNKKLNYRDIKRLSDYIDQSIFKKGDCCLWKGYVTNSNVTGKVQYINFYFKGRKTALHRILYCNFVSPLGDNEYLKFTCNNRGKCCNLDHMKKHVYLTSTTDYTESDTEPDSDTTDDLDSRGKEEQYTISFS